jgi:predicted transposase YdaD
MGWQDFLAKGPASLWSLLPLTRDGRSEEALRGAYEAIASRKLPLRLEADQLAVLWFVAEAEEVPVQLLKEFLTREKLMQSSLYQEIFSEGAAEGEVRGRAEGEARGEARGQRIQQADAIHRVLTARLGYVDLGVRQRVRAETDTDTLSEWYQEALLCTDADGARRLAEKIQRAPLPVATPAS